ncbi:MAG: SH3 domain-containing protein [Chloroflexi bacterium]|nr:SH3 domain-containing protein [Chloroflexota bacterium]
MNKVFLFGFILIFGLACRTVSVLNDGGGGTAVSSSPVNASSDSAQYDNGQALGVQIVTSTPTATRRGTVGGQTTDVLRVREGAGTDYIIVGRVAKDARVTVIGRTSDSSWYYLVDPLRGWVNAPYVELDEPAVLAEVPVILATPTATGLPSTLPAVSRISPTAAIQFFVEPSTLWYLGQCTNLWWNIENVKEVYLSGVGVPGHGNMRVCPQRTTAYQLHIIKTDGTVEDVWVRVTVLATQAPQVLVVTATPGPTQTPWVITVVVTATPTSASTPTITPTPTRTPTPTSTP